MVRLQPELDLSLKLGSHYIRAVPENTRAKNFLRPVSLDKSPAIIEPRASWKSQFAQKAHFFQQSNQSLILDDRQSLRLKNILNSSWQYIKEVKVHLVSKTNDVSALWKSNCSASTPLTRSSKLVAASSMVHTTTIVVRWITRLYPVLPETKQD